MLSSILGLALWVNQISITNNNIIDTYEERISLLEEQLSIVDSVNADSMTGVSAQLQFLDKEIRKLWDLSNKRNKVDIQKTIKEVDKLNTSINTLAKNLKESKNLSDKNRVILGDNISKLDKLTLLVMSLADEQKAIKSLQTEILIMDESLQALNNYRKQNNANIIELQNEIRLLSTSIQGLKESSLTLSPE
jgi:predicted  nucleic acid-binding Zn-ribbon protein